MTDPTRNIHIIGALVAGGAERFVVDLLVELKRQGVPVELLCLLPKRDAVGAKWAKRLEDAGIPIASGPAERMRPSTILWLAKQLRASDIDIVHVHLDYVEVGYYASKFLHRKNYRVLRTVHNTAHPKPGLQTWAFNHSGIRCSITCGEAAHAAYQGMTKGPMTCVPYGLNFDWPRHDPTHREERLSALNLDPSKTHYMAAGRMSAPSLREAQKAQDDLIRAWKQGGLGANGGALHLLGDGNLRPELERIAAGDDSVTFHGVVPNIPEWMGGVDVYVMPSRYEGLPLAGIECTATGIPSVFSEIAPLRELGNTVATFFPVGDIDALAQRLTERLGARETASAEAVDAARDRFGIERSANEYRTVYHSLT